jgi:hypothetical protein
MKFMKAVKFFFVTLLVFLPGCVYLEDGHETELPAVALNTASIEDLHLLKSLLEEKTSRSGLPSEENLGHWFYENHLRRVEEGNPYHLYAVRTQCGQCLGYVQLGVMPTLGYCIPQHVQIVDKWVALGVIQKVPDSCGCALTRVDNRGLAYMLPILKDDLTRCEEIGIIYAAYEKLRELRAGGQLLPNEKTMPHQVISLLKPSNDLIESFEGVGFKVDENKGFFEFYHKDRAMLTKCLE